MKWVFAAIGHSYVQEPEPCYPPQKPVVIYNKDWKLHCRLSNPLDPIIKAVDRQRDGAFSDNPSAPPQCNCEVPVGYHGSRGGGPAMYVHLIDPNRLPVS